MIHVTNDFKSLLPSCRWIKYLSPKTTKYIIKFWEISVKRTSNFNYISVIKNSCFDQHFLGMYGSNHSTNSLVTIFVSMLRTSPHIYSATSYISKYSCKTWNISTDAFVDRCSIVKVFITISQNLQETTCTRDSF